MELEKLKIGQDLAQLLSKLERNQERSDDKSFNQYKSLEKDMKALSEQILSMRISFFGADGNNGLRSVVKSNKSKIEDLEYTQIPEKIKELKAEVDANTGEIKKLDRRYWFALGVLAILQILIPYLIKAIYG